MPSIGTPQIIAAVADGEFRGFYFLFCSSNLQVAPVQPIIPITVNHNLNRLTGPTKINLWTVNAIWKWMITPKRRAFPPRDQWCWVS